ncbi:putative DNA ligase III [Balamuthia mandrillaris]
MQATRNRAGRDKEGPRFFKFPRTPHVAGSEVVDDDEVVGESALFSMVENKDVTVVVQEKMDGTNVSVHFEEEWVPVAQKRSGIIGTGEKRQYDVFRNWVNENMEGLFAVLGTDYCLFGEWLWCKHAVGYDSLPSFFLCFDILDKRTERFLCYKKVRQMVGGRYEMVPTLLELDAAATPSMTPAQRRQRLEGLLAEVQRRKSQHGGEVMEGLYIRFEDAQHVVDRMKLRRKTFQSGRQDFASRMQNNRCKDN